MLSTKQIKEIKSHQLLIKNALQLYFEKKTLGLTELKAIFKTHLFDSFCNQTKYISRKERTRSVAQKEDYNIKISKVVDSLRNITEISRITGQAAQKEKKVKAVVSQFKLEDKHESFYHQILKGKSQKSQFQKSIISFEVQHSKEVEFDIDSFFHKKINQKFSGPQNSPSESTSTPKWQKFTHRRYFSVDKVPKQIFKNQESESMKREKQEDMQCLMDSYLQAFKKQLTYKSKEGTSARQSLKIKDRISMGDVQQEFVQKVVFGQQSPNKQGNAPPMIQSLEDEVQNLFSPNKGTLTENTDRPTIKIRKPRVYPRQSLCLSPRARESPPRNSKIFNGQEALIKPEPTVSFYQIKNKMERKNLQIESIPQLIFQETYQETPASVRREKDLKNKVKLPKFENPPSFLDTFINVNRWNPVFREAFLQPPKKQKDKLKSMKRAASSVLATIKMASSLGKVLKVKSQTCNQIKKLAIVKDQQEYKKKATAILFKSKKLSEFHRSKKKLLFERRKMSEDTLLDYHHNQRNMNEMPELCQSTMQSVQKNRETKVEEMNKIKFYGI